ncbi:hypothetical protein JMK10_19295, partial [Rhodovulum sulfidophilum]|uniref:hypothetical protein n=1 Tax=Rhodovulum sulfidophilum TaxID=35806 RepID=UPI001F1D8B6B
MSGLESHSATRDPSIMQQSAEEAQAGGDRREGLTIELHGALAGLLRLATGAEALTQATMAGSTKGDRLEGI